MRKFAICVAMICPLIGVGKALSAYIPKEHTIKPCAVEDQLKPNCYWLANKQGNRIGSSYVVIGGQVYYLKGEVYK